MIGKALRTMRVFHDLTQKDLAEKLEISTSHLSEIESGKKSPTLSLLERYANVFNIPISSILFFSENMDLENPRLEKARVMISSKVLALLNFITERSDLSHVGR
ncbi:helix-turn-helix transcriptional regulator [uncultured Thiodictyon sp.]|uniref:helix-turn-helix transcriptional regulator n=1 Tax=uncultured Thiodictyon sp. TaxID=1846217 RepID=UPI002600E04A|nr:helix-turn-helix transcriptional regulator [uncultured Thiodictyon sp.]